DLKIAAENLLVAKRNLIFPSGILAIGMILILGIMFVKETMARSLLVLLVLALVFYDLYRFGIKFTPFTTPDYFYPQTRLIEFLQKDMSIFRIASNDSRIFPPNFSTFYKIQSIEGYDPLYLKSYAELIAASERQDHSIKLPYGFNRIITPHNIDSPMIDLLNVKYILSLSDLSSPKLKKVFQEGQTRIYENTNVFPRAFFVGETIRADNNEETIRKMFSEDLSKVALVSKGDAERNNYVVGQVRIVKYDENRIDIESENEGDGFLILTDVYYPTWNAEIDKVKTEIYKVNHAFRGIFVQKGKHKISFYNSIF
ncbi:MAG: YfhO family protein, partial [Nanoarchaeota archaeon]